MVDRIEQNIDPRLIAYSCYSFGHGILLFLFFMILFTSTAIPFRLIPIPSLGLLFRFFLMAVIMVVFPIPGIQRSRYANIYFVGVLLFSILIFISLFYTESFAEGRLKCLRFFLNVTIPCILLYLVYLSEDEFRIMCSAIMIGAILSLIVTLITTRDFNNPLGRGDMSLSSGITLARSFGMGFLVLFSRTVFTSHRHIFSTIVFIAIGVLLLVGVILTGTRGVMISLVMTIATVIFFLLVKRRSLKTILLIVMVLILSISLFASNPYIKQTAGYKRYRALYRQVIGRTAYDSSRVKMYIYSYKKFLQNPMTGLGAGGSYSFNLTNFEGINVGYSHNIILEIATEFGAIGLSILGMLLLPCGLVLARIIKTIRKRNIILLSNRGDNEATSNDERNTAIDIILGYYENTELTVAILFVFLFIHAQISGDIASNFRLWIMGVIMSSLPPLSQGLKIRGRKVFLEYLR